MIIFLPSGVFPGQIFSVGPMCPVSPPIIEFPKVVQLINLQNILKQSITDWKSPRNCSTFVFLSWWWPAECKVRWDIRLDRKCRP